MDRLEEIIHEGVIELSKEYEKECAKIIDGWKIRRDAWKAKALRLIGFLNKKDKEIERLRKLVKSAYNEGWDGAMSDEGGYNEGLLDRWWEMSEILKELKDKP